MNVTVVIDLMATVLWIVFIGLIVLTVARAARNRPIRGMGLVIVAAGISALVLSLISAGLVFIQPEERGVVISAVAEKGYRDEALQPGLNWIIPFFENVRTYRISRQTYTMTSAPNEGAVQGDDAVTARTSDGQEIYLDASVIYSVDPAQVVKVHINWQDRFTDELVRPQARGIVRDVISQYGVQDVITNKRNEIIQEINKTMTQKMDENGLVLEDFILRNITFSKDYATSVEQKQIAEQQAQQARLTVERKKQEAEQARQEAQGRADAVVIEAKGNAEARLAQAEAESQALEMLSKALQDKPELLQYSFITRIGPGVQTIFLPNNVPYIFPLPTTGSSAANPAVTDLNNLFPPAQPQVPIVPTAVPTVEPTPTPSPTPVP
jgi:regulator of protease activity HflC (stomatin/prohibitin superfamily)